MITRIEASTYRCFRDLAVDIQPQQVLVGPNGAGKTTLLDLPRLLGDMIQHTPTRAFLDSLPDRPVPRAREFQELLHCHRGDYFGLALEAQLPVPIQTQIEEELTDRQKLNSHNLPRRIRYEVLFEVYNKRELQIADEQIYLHSGLDKIPSTGWNIADARPRSWRAIVSRSGGAEATIRSEVSNAKSSLHLEPGELAISSIPRDSRAFPAVNFLRQLLTRETITYEPELTRLRQASPPGRRETLDSTGSGLPWLALELKRTDPAQYHDWVAHVRTALENIEEIDIVEREDDHHAYFRVGYRGGYTVPSSGLSDGTLRIMALTLPAYLRKTPAVLVVEEPENGIHPRAIETVMQSLSWIYDSQVWISTHSPVVLALTKLENLLLMQRDNAGAVHVVRGDQHPRLVQWREDIEDRVGLDELFVAGVLS